MRVELKEIDMKQLNKMYIGEEGKATSVVLPPPPLSRQELTTLFAPSSSFINLSLDTNPKTITAPETGYLCVTAYAEASNAGYINFVNSTCHCGVMQSITANNAAKIMMPVKKEDTIVINYGNLNKIEDFRFVYAEGTKPSTD